MELSFEKLNMNHFIEVKNIFIESFFNNQYFINLFPDKNVRTKNFEKVVFPAVDYCLKHNSAIAAISNGKICGYNLMAEYNKKNKKEFEQIFFDPYIKAGDEELSTFRDRLRKKYLQYGAVEYIYIGVVSKKVIRQGIGRRLNKHILKKHKDKCTMTEITSSEMLALYNSFKNEHKIQMEKLSDNYTITTILPEAEKARINGGRNDKK